MSTAIRARGLTKRFKGGQLAVADLDLEVPQGSIYGFLGPNGSGKTTTIRMLLGLISATAGEVELLGQTMPAAATQVLPRVGALIEGPGFHSQLSGRANLQRLDDMDRHANARTASSRIDSALKRVGLEAAAGKRYRAYSLGMRQRLGLAASLLQPRELLILDEPTNGLDPQGTREVRRLITEVAAEGTTVLLSTHLLPEVEQICSQVGIMRAGRLVTSGTLSELRSVTSGKIRITTPTPEALVRYAAEQQLPILARQGDNVTITLGERRPQDLLAELAGAGIAMSAFVPQTDDLEDVFVRLTGEGFDVSG